MSAPRKAPFRESDAVVFQREPGAAWEAGAYVAADYDPPGWHRVRDQAFGQVHYIPSRRLKHAPPTASVRVTSISIEGDSDAVAELGSVLANALKKETP